MKTVAAVIQILTNPREKSTPPKLDPVENSTDRTMKVTSFTFRHLHLFHLLETNDIHVLIPSSDLRERLIRILEGLGGQAGCHMYWALGSRRSLLGCLFRVRWVLLGGVT